MRFYFFSLNFVRCEQKLNLVYKQNVQFVEYGIHHLYILHDIFLIIKQEIVT